MMDTAVDLSYKDGALTVSYDIESLPDLFTIVFIHDKAVTLLFYGDDTHNGITDDELSATMRDYMSQTGKLDSFPDAHNVDDLDYNVIRAHCGGDIRRVVNKFTTCQPLPSDRGYRIGNGEGNFIQYAGWNSSAYDLPLMVLIQCASIARGTDAITPQSIREFSDALIGYSGPPWKMAHYLEERLGVAYGVTAEDYKTLMNRAAHRDGHIDWAKIAKLTEDGGQENRFPPGLKKEMARFGFDIIEDELVTGSVRQASKKQVLDLVFYNVNDVLGTRLLGMNDKIAGLLETRDIVRRLYPHTSARATLFEQLGRRSPLERDTTAASLVGSVLIGPNRIRPRDSEAVSYLFPLPDGTDEEGNTVYRLRDLLEFMSEHEDFMHPDYYTFFDHFRGKDTRKRDDERSVVKSQPVTGDARMNIPYYRDGKPVDAYIRVSTGGAHGSVMAGLSKKTENEVSEWIRSDVGALDSEKPTVDLPHVHHLDWSSFYPVMASKLALYATEDGEDRYTGIIEHRFSIKRSLPHNRAEWTEEHVEANALQTGLKFLLNNASGAGNTHKPYALLPVDNRTLSMRLIGNQMIWCLAQRCTQAGGFVIATNTDGIFVAGLSDEEIQRVVDDYVRVYGMDVDPEVEDRFINRDTSNRIEISSGVIQAVGGHLRHGKDLSFADSSVGNNVAYPLAAAHAAIRYMVDDEEWLTKPYDPERMAAIMADIRDKSTTAEAWFHVHVGTSALRLTVDGVRMAKVNRVVLTNGDDAAHLAAERRAELRKAEVRDFLSARATSSDPDYLSDQLSVTWADEWTAEQLASAAVCFKEDSPTGRGSKVPVPLTDQPSVDVLAEKSAFDAWWRDSGAATLAVRDGEGYVPVKVWRDGRLTGYPSDKGAVLNTTAQLSEFDLDSLDLAAYVRWAESLLRRWKVTADIPEIGMESIDDSVGEADGSAKRGGRVTKADRARDLVRWLYASTWKESVD